MHFDINCTTLCSLVSPGGSVFVSPTNIPTTVNSIEIISCSAQGGPSNVIDWRKNGVLINGESDPVLLIPMVTGSDGGVYQCTVSNAAGSGTATSRVNGMYTSIAKSSRKGRLLLTLTRTKINNSSVHSNISQKLTNSGDV